MGALLSKSSNKEPLQQKAPPADAGDVTRTTTVNAAEASSSNTSI